MEFDKNSRLFCSSDKTRDQTEQIQFNDSFSCLNIAAPASNSYSDYHFHIEQHAELPNMFFHCDEGRDRDGRDGDGAESSFPACWEI